MVHGGMVHQVTTVGVHTPPPRTATPPSEEPEQEETFVPDVAMTMEDVVQLAVQNKDKVKAGFEREAQVTAEVAHNDAELINQRDNEDKDEAHPSDGDKDSTLSAATGGSEYTLQGSGKTSLASQIGGSVHTENGTKTSSRPSSSDRTVTSSRPPSSGRAVIPKRPNSKERAMSSGRPPSNDKGMSSSRPTSKGNAMNSSRPTSKDRTMSSTRPNSKDRAINSSRSTSRDRAMISSRPTSKERAMSSRKSTSRERVMNSSRPSSLERGTRSGPPSRPTSRERPSNAKTDKKSNLAAVQEGREAVSRLSRPTSRGEESIKSSRMYIKESSVPILQKADHGLPPTAASRTVKSRSSADSPWSKLTAAPDKQNQNQEKNVARLYQRLIKKHVSGNKTEPSKEAVGDKVPALADHASKYKVLSQTPDPRDGSPLQPTREEVSVQKNDALLVGVPLSLNSGSRSQTPMQDTPTSGDTTLTTGPKEGHTVESNSKPLPGQDIQTGRSLLASMAEQNFLNSRSQMPESTTHTLEASGQVDPHDKQTASTNQLQEINSLSALNGSNQSTQQVVVESGSQPESGKQATTDQSITEDGVAASTTSVKDSGGKVPAAASVLSRAALGGSSDYNAVSDPDKASSLTQGNAGASSSVKTVTPNDLVKLPPHSDHGIVPLDSTRGGGLPRALDHHPAPYVPSLRGDVLVKALEESARTNAGDRIALPAPQGQSVMPYHVAPRGSSLSAVEIPEPTLSTVSLAVSKNAGDMGRPIPLREQGTGGIFDRFTSNSSSNSLWHKITPLAVRPSNDSYYREPREYEDYLPREPPRPVLQRRNSLGRINTRDYEDDDYYYDDDYNDNSRHTRVKESRGAQTVRVKNQQPRHSILKKTESRPVRKEEPRSTIRDKLDEYRNTPPIIIASGIVPKNLESLTSEYQATRAGGYKDGVIDTQRNGTKNHTPKEKEHFHDRHTETGTTVTAPLLASSGPKQSIGDVFDRLHNNRRLEHAALVSRRPELKQKPKAVPAKTKEKDASLASITPRAPATEPQRHHQQNGGKDVYSRLYQNAAPARKRRDEVSVTTPNYDIHNPTSSSPHVLTLPAPLKTNTCPLYFPHSTALPHAAVHTPLSTPFPPCPRESPALCVKQGYLYLSHQD